MILDTLHTSKRPAAADWRLEPVQQSGALRGDLHYPETSLGVNLPPSSPDQQAKLLAVKRSSIFSRRPRSTLVPIDADGTSRFINSSLPGPRGTLRSSSVAADMSASEGDGLRSKLSFGRHTRKKSSGAKAPSPPADGATQQAWSRKDGYRETSKRAYLSTKTRSSL
jgi:hypothetical protein